MAAALAGCVTERTKAEPVRIREGALAGAVPAGSRGSGRGTASVVPVGKAVRPAVGAAAPAAAPAASAPVGVVRTVAAGAAAPPAPRPRPAGRSLGDVAREKFLSSATTIDAEKATVTLPPDLAAEARLEGTTVTSESPTRRVAAGVAVLTLRRLTVRARRLVLSTREDGASDVQVSARGNASLRSDQPASVLEESGLKALLLTNDGYMPLR